MLSNHYSSIRYQSDLANFLISLNCFVVKLVERNPCPNGFQLVDPAKSGKKNQFDLVELAKNIQTADQFTRATAGSKLSVIAEQVRFLQQQAQAVLEEANLNAELHHIACNFKKVPGKIYYVYKRPESGAKYMSMISPEVSLTFSMKLDKS